jgi:hypothetical protein
MTLLASLADLYDRLADRAKTRGDSSARKATRPRSRCALASPMKSPGRTAPTEAKSGTIVRNGDLELAVAHGSNRDAHSLRRDDRRTTAHK